MAARNSSSRKPPPPPSSTSSSSLFPSLPLSLVPTAASLSMVKKSLPTFKEQLKESKRRLKKARVLAAKAREKVMYLYFKSNISHSVRIATALIPTTLAWLGMNVLNSKQQRSLKNLLPSLLAASSQGVGFVGTLDIYENFKQNLGVRQTLPKLYQLFSLIGYMVTTVGQLPLLSTGVGRIFFTFNAMSLSLYVYMAYLTLTYNRGLEDRPTRFFEAQRKFRKQRHRINIPALSGWFTLNLLVLYVWFSEARNGLHSVYKNEILASIGFLMQSIGSIRAGLQACMTSQPEIQPFDGAMTIATSNLLAALSLMPLSSKSPLARIYIAGYASVLYNSLINAYYAYQEESLGEESGVGSVGSGGGRTVKVSHASL